MKINKLEEALQKEQTKKEKLIAERQEIDNKIKECMERIEEYEIKLNNNKFKDFQAALQSHGIPFETIMEAIQNNDFLSLQEKLEASMDQQGKKDGQN